jgi:hypothetical protein
LGVLYVASIDEQWRKLKKELSSCHGLLKELQNYEFSFKKFNSWYEVIDQFKKTSWYIPQSDLILKPILQLTRRNNDPRWNIVWTALFWHVLESIFLKKIKFNIDHMDDLWQNINWAFLEVVYSLNIGKYKHNYAYLIYIKILNSLYTTYQLLQDVDRHEQCVDSMELVGLIGYADDAVFDELKITIYLRSYLLQGVITKTEYHLLERTLRYHELISECAGSLGLGYEAAKRQRQRALRKIQKIEKKLSPYKSPKKLFIYRGGK